MADFHLTAPRNLQAMAAIYGLPTGQPSMSDRLMSETLLPGQGGGYLSTTGPLASQTPMLDMAMPDYGMSAWDRFRAGPNLGDVLNLLGPGRGSAMPRGVAPRPRGDTPVYGGEMTPFHRRFELPPAQDPAKAANLNTPRKPEWQDYNPPSDFGAEAARRGNPAAGGFLTDPQGETLASLPGTWKWNDATNSGAYSYTPRLVSPIQGGRATTETFRGPTFQTREAGQAYAEAVLRSGRYEPIDAAPFMELDARLMRQQAANTARQGFQLIPPDYQQ